MSKVNPHADFIIHQNDLWNITRVLHEYIPSVINNLKERRKIFQETGSTIVGIPSGFSTLDNLIGGFQPGIHLLAAEPGQGKTSFAVQLSCHATSQGYPVLFISLEESLERVTLRGMSLVTGTESKQLMDGTSDLEKIGLDSENNFDSLKKLYVIEANSRLTARKIADCAYKILNLHQADKCLVVIDYIQRLVSVSQGKSPKERQHTEFRHMLNHLINDIREYSLELHCPFLLICSQNRPGQGGSRLTSLKESGDLEYSGDTVSFLVEAEGATVPAGARAINFHIEKNRFGPSKVVVPMIFRPNLGKFAELDDFQKYALKNKSKKSK